MRRDERGRGRGRREPPAGGQQLRARRAGADDHAQQRRLGGNGILLDNRVIRHMTDIEVLHTYEGTETIQTLIAGRDITGVSAFA